MAVTPGQLAALTDCGTVVRYRDGFLINCETREFNQTVTFDESRTDLLYHKTILRVVGQVHLENEFFGLSMFYVDNDTVIRDTPQKMLAGIRRYFQHPRGDFYLYHDGIEVQRCLGETSPDTTLAGSAWYEHAEEYDVRNGPKPMDVHVTKVVGSTAYQVEFSIELCQVFCDGEVLGTGEPYEGAQDNQFVLNNRWSLEEHRDDNFYMSRTLTGKLVVRARTFMPHLFRHLCMPTQQRGYQFTGARFLQSADGLSLNYTITHKQRHAAPPRPAVKWRGTHTETVESFGHTGIASVNISLEGAPGTPKIALFNAAVRTVEHRLGNMRLAADTEGDATVIPLSLTLVDTLHENQIDLTVTAKRVPRDGTTGYANILITMLGKLPAVNAVVPAQGNQDDDDRDDQVKTQYNRDSWPSPIPYDGSTPAGMFLHYLQSPCVSVHGVPNVTPDDPQNEYPDQDLDDNTPPTIQVYEGEDEGTDVAEDDYDKIHQDHKDFQYTHYECESKYEYELNRAFMPIAGVDDPEADPSIAVATVGPETAYRVVTLRGQRVGQRPAMPEVAREQTDENGIQEFLARREIIPHAPLLLANGNQYLWQTEERYWYALERPPTDAEKLRSGRLPFDITVLADSSYQRDEHTTDTLI